jgi:hypothetical protein
MVKDYLARSRAPRYSILFALPLLLLYEVWSFALNRSAYAGIRNGADVILKTLFITLGGRSGLLVFDVLLLGGGAVLVWRDRKRADQPLEGRTFLLMGLESGVYAALFGVVVGYLTALLLAAPRLLQIGGGSLDLSTRLVTSLGAGIYEELLFRVILTGGLLALLHGAFGFRRGLAATLAVVLSAVIFSAFHYVGALGDRLTLASFLFRAIAGLAFSGLYVTRGLGITAWTHALYDVGITLIQS